MKLHMRLCVCDDVYMQALVLIVQSANFIRVRECEKRSYRPEGNY